MMTCTDFQAILPDYLETNALGSAERSAADAHVERCDECARLVTELRAIMRDATALPVLAPSRDLWDGIESRIEAPVVALATGSGEVPAAVPTAPIGDVTERVSTFRWGRLAIAASALIAVSAGVTYSITSRSLGARVPLDSTLVVQPSVGTDVRAVSRPTATETFDREIAQLRTLVDARRSELDPVTVGIVEKNLKLIDRAIAESKAALATDPANAFLTDQLTHAYDTKLQLLREIAMRSPRS